MGLATNCRECEYFVHTRNPGTGYCNRAEDPDFAYPVAAASTKCLYEVPGFALSEERFLELQAIAEEQHRRFRESGERARREVASWPEWMQKLLG